MQILSLLRAPNNEQRGGLFIVLYAVMMGIIGREFRGGDLVFVYSVMSIAWGVGAFIGPGATGVAMDITKHGLPYFAAFACALFVVLPTLRTKRA
ncbi:hypothetical protein NKW84_02430 [Acetobacter senegalensis]|uniref:hypothetical protein n=1 Tax=Acetobacter senegalensis TaxID=446692 RepID=UPI0020A2337A|nr:hypothetical protein [Acetobacter senegalensis]MCP1194716.1 hypothetical protein [Acetobacter senegalensis]